MNQTKVIRVNEIEEQILNILRGDKEKLLIAQLIELLDDNLDKYKKFKKVFEFLTLINTHLPSEFLREDCFSNEDLILVKNALIQNKNILIEGPTGLGKKALLIELLGMDRIDRMKTSSGTKVIEHCEEISLNINKRVNINVEKFDTNKITMSDLLRISNKVNRVILEGIDSTEAILTFLNLLNSSNSIITTTDGAYQTRLIQEFDIWKEYADIPFIHIEINENYSPGTIKRVKKVSEKTLKELVYR